MSKEKLNKLQEVINDQLSLIEMNVARINNLLKYIRSIEKQLQAYKQKEDKLREYIYSVNNWNWKKLEGKNGTQIIREELLQILNEGDK